MPSATSHHDCNRLNAITHNVRARPLATFIVSKHRQVATRVEAFSGVMIRHRKESLIIVRPTPDTPAAAARSAA
jgi:hypothetical protein